jgi:AcrR family transcriptional regulator
VVVEAAPLRADAQRNLERILEAARVVFAEHGLDACVSDVAERAGVGTATIFRRFATKDDLCAAILERELETIAVRAREAADSSEPADALAAFMTWAVERYIDDRCLCEAGESPLLMRPRVQELSAEIIDAVRLLLRRGQKAGAVRRDIVAEDIAFLLSGIGQAGLRLERAAPGAWRRYVTLVLDGLRPEGASRLRHAPPTPEQVMASKATPARSSSS